MPPTADAEITEKFRKILPATADGMLMLTWVQETDISGFRSENLVTKREDVVKLELLVLRMCG